MGVRQGRCGIISAAPLASGQAVRRLTLDQEIEGSNPSSPASYPTGSGPGTSDHHIWWFRAARAWRGLQEGATRCRRSSPDSTSGRSPDSPNREVHLTARTGSRDPRRHPFDATPKRLTTQIVLDVGSPVIRVRISVAGRWHDDSDRPVLAGGCGIDPYATSAYASRRTAPASGSPTHRPRPPDRRRAHRNPGRHRLAMYEWRASSSVHWC